VNTAAAFTLFADAMYLKFYEADLGIRVGSLCKQDCFFVAGGEGEEDETFPIPTNEDSTLALERAVCEEEKFMQLAIRLTSWQEFVQYDFVFHLYHLLLLRLRTTASFGTP
jgi:hypothetical protein